MSIRKNILSVALVGAFVAPAFASGTPYASEQGEATYSGPMPGDVIHQMPGAKSRAEVVREVQLVRQNDTLRWVGDYPKNATVASANTGSTASRDSVRRELQAFQQNPVTADGYRFIGGEIGYVYVGTQTAHRRARS